MRKSSRLITAGALVLTALCTVFPSWGQDAERPAAVEVGSAIIGGDDVTNFGESKYFNRVTGSYREVVSDATAVLLIAASPEIADGAVVDEQWLSFCGEMGWNLAVVSVQAKTDMPRADWKAAGGWLDQALFRWLAEVAVDDGAEKEQALPVYACALGAVSNWVVEGLLDRPSQVRAWVGKGFAVVPAQAKTSNLDKTSKAAQGIPPGLLISSAGNFPRPDTFRGFRLANPSNRVAYLPFQGRRVGDTYLYDLARQFLRGACVLDGKDTVGGVWCRFSDGTAPTMEEIAGADIQSLSDFMWFPNWEVVGAWKTLCRMRAAEPKNLVSVTSEVVTDLPEFVTFLEFHHSRLNEEPKAILLLAVEAALPQKVFQSQAWIDFARQQGFSIVVMNFRRGRTPSENEAAAWLGNRLFEFIDGGALGQQAGLPVVLHATKRPAYWMQRILVQRPKRFVSWCVVGAAKFAMIPPDERLPPGLLVSTTAESNFPHLFFLQDVRKANKANRVCMLASDDELLSESYIDEFSRNFLADAISPQGNGFWLRYRDGERLTLDSNRQGVDPADYVWLPNSNSVGAWNLLSRERPEIPFPTIRKIAVKTNVEEQPEMSVFVRVPGSLSGQNEKKRSVSGVLSLCTWEREDHSLLNRLKNPADPLVAFADRNNLAIITWNTATLLPPEIRVQELDEQGELELAKKFDLLGEAWLKGVEKICRDNKLPDREFLLYGVSRGSTYAHRLALRYPEKFLAVNTHIANHYVEPSKEASDLMWLVTTGELDGGYSASRQFYQEAKDLNFPVLFKAGPSLGHAMREDIETLSLAFFDFAWQLRNSAIALRNDPANANLPAAKVTAAELCREQLEAAPYFGDFINHEVYSVKEGDWIPESQRIPLPTEELANAWGTLPEGGL